MIFGETFEKDVARRKDWRRVFAVWPTRLYDGRWVWLQFYEYRDFWSVDLGWTPHKRIP